MIRFVPKTDLHASTVKTVKPQASKTPDAHVLAVSLAAAAVASDDAEDLTTSPRSLSAEPVAEPLELSGDAPVRKQASKRKTSPAPKKVSSRVIEPGDTGGDLLLGLGG